MGKAVPTISAIRRQTRGHATLGPPYVAIVAERDLSSGASRYLLYKGKEESRDYFAFLALAFFAFAAFFSGFSFAFFSTFTATGVLAAIRIDRA